MRFLNVTILSLVVVYSYALDPIPTNTTPSLLWTPWLSESQSVEGNLTLAPVEVFFGYNGSEPSTGWGDGALWQGAGLNTSLQAGLRWVGPYWDLSFQPLVWSSANEPFSIPAMGPNVIVNNNPPYGDAHRGTWDHPLRMGAGPLYRWDLGQTRARVFWGPLYTEIGTTNQIWGASRYNSILLSSNGPGVPRVQLGLDPWVTSWGTFEGHLLYGQLKASGLQIDNGQGGTRLWSGLFLGYSPPFAPGLTLGAARTADSYWSKLVWTDFLLPFSSKQTSTSLTTGVNEGPKYDQRVSLMYRYRVPSVGLELYGEWSRNDYNHTLAWWFNQLEHSQNWVLGVTKYLALGEWGNLQANAELGVLSLGTENFIHPSNYSPNGADIYTNSTVTEGYTIDGQDLGAAAGNGNYMLIDLGWNKGVWTVGQRFVRWVKDYSELVATRIFNGTFYTDVSYLWDTSVQYRFESWRFSGTLGANIETNRLFDATGGDYNTPPIWQSWHTSASVAYLF